jgi:hypothetical protein
MMMSAIMLIKMIGDDRRLGGPNEIACSHLAGITPSGSGGDARH